MTTNPPLERILGWLATGIRFVEDVNSILSSVLISLALTIAVMDLVTGGALLQHLSALVYLWAGSVAVGVEATLVSAFDRAHQAWLEARRSHAALWLGLGILLAAVGFVGVTAFTLQQSLHIGETVALSMMGLSPLAFDLGRSALTVLLACVAGVTRPRKKPTTHQDRKRELQEAIDIEPLKQRLDSLRRKGKKGAPNGPTSPDGGTPVAQSPNQTNRREWLEVLTVGGANRESARVAASLTARERVYRLLAKNPNLSKTQLARLAHVSESTASKWRGQWRAEVEEAAQAAK